MSAFQTILSEIVSKRPDISEEQIRDLIEQKKKELPGFLSDEGAARLVAEELLVKTRGTELGRMQVSNLVSGLNDVSISGRILMYWPQQEFQRRDGTSGKVMRLIIVDRSGKARCVLWDRHVEVASRTSTLQGSIIRIGHAYTRQGMSGDVEIHAGDRSSIEFNPRISTSDFPELDELFVKIRDVPKESFNINTVGVSQSAPKKYSFTKEGKAGAVLRTIIADKSGTIPVVAWNERADQLSNLIKGDILQVINARSRLDSNSQPELHIETRTQAEILKEPPAYLEMPIERTYKIAELTAQNPLTNLSVGIIAKGDRREIKRPTGEALKVSSLMVGDETGIITVSLWDEKSQLIDDLQEGESVFLHDVSIRDRLGELQLSLGRTGEIKKLGTTNQNIVPHTKISQLNSVKGLAQVEGTVNDLPIIRQVVTKKGETVDIASFTLKDETGSTRVTFWREQARLAKELQSGMKLQMTGVRVRTGLTGEMELSSIPLMRISVISIASIIPRKPDTADDHSS